MVLNGQLSKWKKINSRVPQVPVDSKLDFKFNVDQKIEKCNELIDLIRRISVNFPRKALLTIYKSFVRTHRDYGDTVCSCHVTYAFSE